MWHTPKPLTQTYQRWYSLKQLNSCRQLTKDRDALEETRSYLQHSPHIEGLQAKVTLTPKSIRLKHKRTTVPYSSRSLRPVMSREEARRLYEILKESELLASPHQPSEETKSEALQCVRKVHHKETNTPEANSKLQRSLDRHLETSFKGTSYPVPRVLSSVRNTAPHLP